MTGDRVVAPGAYRITIGEGQSNTGVGTVEGKLTVTGTAAVPQ